MGLRYGAVLLLHPMLVFAVAIYNLCMKLFFGLHNNNNNNNNKIFIYTRISKSNVCKTVEKYIHTYTPQSHAYINKRKQQCKKCIQKECKYTAIKEKEILLKICLRARE